MFARIVTWVAGRKTATNVARGVLCLLPLVPCSCGSKSERDAEARGSHAVKLTPRGSTVTVVSVGDVLLGSASAPYLATNGFDWPFVQVRPLIENADLLIGNLAAPITAATKKLSDADDFTYKVSRATAPALKRAGFHAFSLGNNHVLDYGMPGLRETIAALQTNGVSIFGAGANETEARRGLVYDFGSLRLGLLGYGEAGSEPKALAKGERGGFALLSEKNLTDDIARLRPQVDVLIVSVHWGKNYQDVADAQRKLGRRAIELGADIVCGHHPHIAQGVEIHNGKPILYSLGNFVFGTRGRFENEQAYGLVTRWIFEGKTLKWVLATPIAVNNDLVGFQPRRVPGNEARQALESHFKRCGTEVRWDGDTAFIGLGQGWQSAALPKMPWLGNANVTTTAPEIKP